MDVTLKVSWKTFVLTGAPRSYVSPTWESEAPGDALTWAVTQTASRYVGVVGPVETDEITGGLPVTVRVPGVLVVFCVTIGETLVLVLLTTTS